MSDKPKFDPSKPFEAAKPKFDPTQEFKVADAEPPVAAIGSPDGKTGAQEERPWYSMTPSGMAQGAVDALPAIGAGAGELVGAIGGPPGMVGGAAMGGTAGKNLKGLIEQYLMGKPTPTREDYYKGLATAGAQGATGSMVGQSAAPALATAGTKLYNNVLSPVESAINKSGKEGIGDVAYDAGIWNPRNIRDKLQAYADQLSGAVKNKYAEATAAGGKLDMEAAMKPAQDHVDEVVAKAGDNEELKELAQKMQDRIDMLKRSGSPTPEQGAFAKSNAQGKVGERGYSELSATPTGKQFEKKVAYGLQKETEKAIGRASGPEAEAEVAAKNADIGKIIGTKSKNAQQALQDLTERQIGSVTSPFPTGTEGMVAAGAGALSHSPENALLAYAAQKGMRGAALGQMPAGYVLKKAAPVVAKAVQANPWAGPLLVNKAEGE